MGGGDGRFQCLESVAQQHIRIQAENAAYLSTYEEPCRLKFQCGRSNFTIRVVSPKPISIFNSRRQISILGEGDAVIRWDSDYSAEHNHW